MKTPLAGPNAMNRIRVFLIATCITAVTPRLSGDIILLNRLSDAEAYARIYDIDAPPARSQVGFMTANLCNIASVEDAYFLARGTSTSSSSIFINNPTEGLRVVGDGSARAEVACSITCLGDYLAETNAKVIVLTFDLTVVSYPYSMTGYLNGANATATLTSETGTIFEEVGTAPVGTTLSESGTLPPGNYTLSVRVYANDFSHFEGFGSDANFAFEVDGPMSTPTPTPTPMPTPISNPITRATNLSTRLLVGTGNDVGIGGFIVTGNGPRHLLLRGIGPSLNGIITRALPDPRLTLYGSSCPPPTNDNWRGTQEAEIIATGRAPSNDLESAILADLAPGAYTVLFRGTGATTGTTGIGLVEIWDLSTDQDSRLANISTRGNIGTGNDIMIAGVILNGAGGEDTIIVRGLGTSLCSIGLPCLPDPKLELRNSQGGLIASDNNWMDDPNQAAIIRAAGLALSNDLESAIVATLMPGEYTALLSGVNNGTGVGLVEVYDNPAIGPTPTPTPGESATQNRTTSEVQDFSVTFGHKNCMMLRDSAEW